MSQTAYPCNQWSQLLLRGKRSETLLINNGPAIVYLSQTSTPSILTGIPLGIGGTMLWAAGQDLWGMTAPSTSAVLLAASDVSTAPIVTTMGPPGIDGTTTVLIRCDGGYPMEPVDIFDGGFPGTRDVMSTLNIDGGSVV